jgi:hypothetical protein
LPRAFSTRFGPPSGFGYPLDGLRPSNPRRLCFAPAALLGFALRSLTTHMVSVHRYTDAPTYRWPAVTPPLARQPDLHTAVPGLRPMQRLHPGPRVFSTPADGRSLGVRPSRVRSRKPCRDFARTPLPRFAQSTLYKRTSPASQSLDRFSAGPTVTPAAEFGGRRG